MIVKERKTPMMLLKLEALLRRIPKKHSMRSIIESDFMKIKTGYNGEKKIDYYLDVLSMKEYNILHNIRLENEEKQFFQIDTVIITNKYILILEIKNMLGNLRFERDFNQFIRVLGENEESFPNPILQVNRHQKQLRAFLEKYKLEIPSIYSFIIISNSSSVIKTTIRNSQVLDNIFHAEQLPLKIQKLNEIKTNQIFSSNQIRKISKAILKYHTTQNTNVLEKYNIDKTDIIKGVICPNCTTNMMKRTHGSWCCVCTYQSKDAHIQAIYDYGYLMGPSISNIECRDFLQLSSRSSSTNLLKSLNLKQIGCYKSTKYLFEFDD
ncbi:nuclease-related domain-containing protein [Bacillus sp. AFS041924]|uniref:nuclease-related domain-containing protein n=1 Tax=Bacillus sp. AFS041924 TaxID=2033503 RepID=UPI000BFB76E8|nr:nuclease-related domain-containing protein [Bacillus sp. AFS041924]PGS55999.1 NERD nuclease [Bacillus sp. AFS041924]